MLNIPEILVANSAGMVMVAFLLFFRFRRQQFIQYHERIFNIMLGFILVAIASETFSFLIDGHVFPGCFFLQYLTNTLCVGSVAVIGFLWCLFVDYRIYRQTKRLKFKAIFLSLPLIVLSALLISNFFGTGVIFSVTADNRYARGSLNFLIYVALFIYFIASLINARNAQKDGITPFFFPIYCFVIPSMIGTFLQFLFYGLSIGWIATSIACVFVYLELQTANYYADALSGLFNRPYMNYYLSQATQQKKYFHGILLDVNDFKSINDVYGHTVGDRAVQAMGKIISHSAFDNAIAMRVGGDEFVIFLSESSDEECKLQMETIKETIDNFNLSETEPFRLSVSMGYARFNGQSAEEFLLEMDEAMYRVKRTYHLSKDNN